MLFIIEPMKEYLPIITEFLNESVLVIHICLSIWVTIHATLKKKNTRAALAWIGLVWLSPIFGAFLYYIFGINRVNRKAIKLNKKEYTLNKLGGGFIATNENMAKTPELIRRKDMFMIGDKLNLSPFFEDTSVETYTSCDKAFESMIESINAAKLSVTCLSYIFDDDEVGERFVMAFSEALKRGVEVRVLVDDVGSISLRNNILNKLKAQNVNCAAFLPIKSFVSGPYANLRNHRKLLIIDGAIAFTGGMNISAKHLEKNGKQAIRDLHFKIGGHVVRPLQRVFMDDWNFTTNEILAAEKFLPMLNTEYTGCAARVIPEAPGEGIGRVVWQFKYAIESAKSHIKIMTPYFLPNSPISYALKSAALRGVSVEVVTPGKLDHQLIHYALMGSISDTLKAGVKFYFSDMPFNHSKLLLVDDDYVSIGSTNWDSRSLELNFELNVEIVSKQFSTEMNEVFKNEKSRAKRLTIKEYKSRSLAVKLRDRLVRLFSPYL